MLMKKVCVFCGSSKGSDPIYSHNALMLGEYLAANSVALIYGGGDIGLMGILSSAVMSKGGHVTGIIPEMLHASVPHKNISELIVVKSMHERKALMYSMSDAFICLPGGIGSLEELLEVFTWLQLGYHSKPVSLLNVNGFYNDLIRQFEIMVTKGFLKQSHLSNLIVKENIDGLLDEMFSSEIHYTAKWNQS
jgi:uncharacterized protein (TIGR00730 family)